MTVVLLLTVRKPFYLYPQAFLTVLRFCIQNVSPIWANVSWFPPLKAFFIISLFNWQNNGMFLVIW